MIYSDKVLNHFKNPHNQGAILDADAIGQEGNPVCGDVMKIYIKVKHTPAPRGRATPLDRGDLHAPASKNHQQDTPPKKGDLNQYVIEDIKFETLGCAAAIAVSSALTDLAKGKTLDEALKITKDEIVEDLGGLPPLKVHCSMLGVDALRKAIENYKAKHITLRQAQGRHITHNT